MANNHGGARTPRNPAPVSGPGQLSRRTDGGAAQQTPAYISGGNYGDGQELMDLQQSAPMAAAPSIQATAPRRVSANANGAPGAAASPLFSPTQRPDEPITAGAPIGPGAGPDPQPSMNDMTSDDIRKMATMIPALEEAANSDFGTDSFRRFVQYMKSVSG